MTDMEDIKITELKEVDAGSLRRINELLAQLSAGARLDAEGLQAIVTSDCSRLFVLHCGTEMAGMLTVGCYPAPTGTKWWIEDVVVDERFCGRSLGKRLVRHAIDFVGERGKGTLMLTSRPARTAANRLYRSLGFQPKETNVYKMVLGE